MESDPGFLGEDFQSPEVEGKAGSVSMAPVCVFYTAFVGFPHVVLNVVQKPGLASAAQA